MSRFLETATPILIATLAIHMATGQGRVTAVILIIESVPVLIESIRRLVTGRSKK